MRAAVRDGWRAFNAPLEGDGVPHFYLDNAKPEAWVTIWLGNKVDPIADALRLPMVRPDGSRASQAEIAEAWHTVKARQDMKAAGGGWFARLTTLRLPEAAGVRLVNAQLDADEAVLRARFAEWGTWPADAQMALHSWAWGVGVHSAYPRMNAALAAGDFLAASEEIAMHPFEGTIVHRNAHNRTLLRNAARVVATDRCPDTLYWPATLLDGPPIA